MAVTPLRRFDRSALARFLVQASGAERVEIGELTLLPGGAIQENWGFTARFAGGPLAGEQALVLRTNAATGVPSSLGRLEEFAVLRAVYAAGVTVAEPLFACADPAVIGQSFFIMRQASGSAQGRDITTDPALEPALPRIAARLGRELARIQTIRPPRPDLAFLPTIGPAEHVAAFRTYLDRHQNPRPVLEWAVRWLETHPPEPLPPVLCHRDFRTGNYLLDGAELTAVLDWEFAGWGDPDEDIGWFCCKGWRFARLDREAGGIAAREPFYRGYEQMAGRRLDPDRIKYWEILANTRWAVIALQQSDRHLIGGARDLSTAIIGRRATECELELAILLDECPPASAMADLPSAAPSAEGDLPSGAGLLALGREWLLKEVLPLLPAEKHRELRLVATAMAIAEREAAAGDMPARILLDGLLKLYPHPDPPPPAGEGADAIASLPPPHARAEAHAAKILPPPPPAGEGGVGAMADAGPRVGPLLRQLAADLRAGAFESCAARAGLARAILWRLTISKLRASNPQFLAANGVGE